MLHLSRLWNKTRAGCRRVLCAVLCAAVAVSAAGSAGAVRAEAAAAAPSCDEAYYAVLDCYGGLTDGGVVKSYRLNGAASVNDYGSYTDVINMTDNVKAKKDNGRVTFDFSKEKDRPDTFYFEGKTAQPYQELPWTIKISYRLNGVDAKAEDTAGKTGLVEINVDITPKKNSGVSAYFRNNLVLAGMTTFNADDILSLEAQGAQVQLVGNLRTVLFLALPGEEQHVSIRVGSNSFSSGGLTFLAVPATLSQIDKISAVRRDKDKAEDSYHAICDSLDVVLDTLDGMSSGLNQSADGLDELNRARAVISAGKSQVSGSADAALTGLDGFSDALQPLAGHLDAAGKMIDETTPKLTALAGNAGALKTQLANTRTNIANVQRDMNNIRSLAKDVESYNSDARYLANRTRLDFSDLNSSLSSLRRDLSAMRSTLNGITFDMPNSKSGKVLKEACALATVTKDQIDQVNALHQQYEATLQAKGLTENDLSFENFIKQAAYQKYLTEHSLTEKDLPFNVFMQQAGDEVNAQAAQADDLWKLEQEYGGEENLLAYVKNLQQMADLLQAASTDVTNIDSQIAKANKNLTKIKDSTSSALSGLNGLTDSLGGSGISGDMERLSSLMNNVLAALDGHKGETSALLGDLNDLGTTAADVTKNLDTAIGLIQSLDDTANKYVPETQQTLKQAESAAASAASAIRSTDSALRAAESLAKQSGGHLDAGTEKTLTGAAESLRSASKSLGRTGSLRSAKDTITGLIDSEWKSHTGENDNLLNMDASATPVSLTSSQNAAPKSIQLILRTKEIKAESKTADKTAKSPSSGTTFWQRFGNIFVGLWNDVVHLFHH